MQNTIQDIKSDIRFKQIELDRSIRLEGVVENRDLQKAITYELSDEIMRLRHRLFTLLNDE